MKSIFVGFKYKYSLWRLDYWLGSSEKKENNNSKLFPISTLINYTLFNWFINKKMYEKKQYFPKEKQQQHQSGDIECSQH